MNSEVSQLPSAPDLMEALVGYMENTLGPSIEAGELDRQRFNLRVALNVIRILQREALADPAPLPENECMQLAEEIRTGRLDETDGGLMQSLRRQTLHRLAINNPKYSAYLAATKD